MLRKLKLYGELAEFVGHKEFDVKVDTLSHAVSFLINNFEGIEQYMSPKYYQVKLGNYELSEDELTHPIGKEDIHFIPVISGAGRGAGKFFLGAALIAGAFLIPGSPLIFGKGFGASLAGAGFGFKAAIGIGGALVLSGVSDMLFPVPKPKEFDREQDPRLSYNFGGTQQTGRSGTPVPLVFGEIFTGSVVISGSIDTEQVQA